MSSQLSHWTLFDSNPLSTPDFHHFTQSLNTNKSQGFFIISAEHRPENNEDRSVSARSIQGAKLAIEAAHFAVSEILENELNFPEVFLTLFCKQWKIAVLLDDKNNFPTVNQLSENKKTTDEQLEILARYDPSLALFYQDKKQMMLLPLGETQIALVNHRYHCDIKKPTCFSLSNLLVDIEKGAQSPFQAMDINNDHLEMVALLSHRYTTSKTSARLHSNIIKHYRQLESKDNSAEETDNSYLLLFKKAPVQASSINTTSQITSSNQPLKKEKGKPKRSRITLALSFFALTTATAGSYFFWQTPVTEANLPVLAETKSQVPPTTQLTTQIALNSHPVDTATLIKEKDNKAAKIKAILLKQEQIATALKQKKEQARKEQQIQAESLKKQQEEKEKQAHQKAEEAEKQRLIEKKARAKQKELKLLKQQQALELAKVKEEESKKRQEQNIHAQKIAEQKVAEQKKNAEEQLRIRKIELEQERKKREQLAKIEAEKNAEKKRLEALVKQRRLEFKNNKERQQREKAKAKANNPPVSASSVKQNKPQDEVQNATSNNIAEKKRNITAELKRQKQAHAKVKTDKLKLKQKIAIHQLVNYSKIFNQHTTQLKQKLNGLKTIDQNNAASTNNILIHKRKLLKDQETAIRTRLGSIAGMYLSTLKLMCTNEDIFPVSTTSANKTERIARKVISQHVGNCSQARSLSASRISATLLDKYLKL